MKIIISIFLLQTSLIGFGQPAKKADPHPVSRKPAVQAPVKKTDDAIYTNPEIEAAFNGSFRNFLEAHLRYPPKAQETGAQGNVIISFIVEKNGTVNSVAVAPESPAKHPVLVNHFCDIIRKSSGHWKPALHHGRKVRSWHSQTIHICPPVVEE